MEEEIWKPIKDYEGLYEVSNLGRVKSLNYKGTGKGKILKNIECSNGYLTVSLTKNGKQKVFYIHRLVAVTFIPNPENKPCIDHINTIRTENCIWNLRWVTYEENNNNSLTKKKMSENHREQDGENNPMYGKHHSDETKRKISENNIWNDKERCEEARKKLSENHANVKGESHPMYGKHHTEETKRKISETLTGKYCGENNPNSKPVIQIDPNTNEIVNTYSGTSEVARQTGFNQSAISSCCRGERKTHKGYKWMYLEDYNKLNEEN